MTVQAAPKWTCDRCRVSVSRVATAAIPLPAGWITGPDGDFCLGCQRLRATEAAIETAPPEADRDARVRLRRDALIEFELHRTPDRPDNSIAKACRTSAAAVANARRRLLERT